MHYDNLDPNGRYKLRVVYAGDNFQAKVRLVAAANDSNGAGAKSKCTHFS